MKVDFFNQKGVTLIELMVAMAIAGIVAAAMFAFQQVQTRSYVTQEALTNMQQNARAAMYFMTSEIRMAGCDPSGNADAEITEATDTSITFTMDIRSDDMDDVLEYNFEGETDNDGPIIDYTIQAVDENISSPGENITYELDENGDLVRIDNQGGGSSVIAQNFDALDFVYLDEDGDRIETGVSKDLNNRDRNRVRAIQITLLVRSGNEAPGFVYRHSDTQVYRNRWSEEDPTKYPEPLYTADDNFRRIMLSKEVRLRNM